MAQLQDVIAIADTLSSDDQEALVKYLLDRRQRTWWIVPSENLARIEEIMRPVHEEAAHMTEEEINAVIDEAIAEVRNERNATGRD